MTRRPARKPGSGSSRPRAGARARGGRVARLRRALGRGLLGLVLLVVAVVAAFAWIDPPRGPYMIAEAHRHGTLSRDWRPLESISGHMARSAVAAEDANFCLHWGFDMAELRRAIETGGARGASTISQQTVKNVFLWQGRSWPRKAMEAALTPLVEATWSKRRILEVYLNVAEFDRGVFGVEAAAQHYFGTSAADLTAVQAARLAAILPDPKGRDAARPSTFVRNRAAAIMDGAATIARDGRAACFAV